MKRLIVTAKFEEVLVKDSRQRAELQVRNIPTGVARALREILKRPGIKGRWHRNIHLEVIVVPINGGGQEEDNG